MGPRVFKGFQIEGPFVLYQRSLEGWGRLPRKPKYKPIDPRGSNSASGANEAD